jgi:NitT/TauT family transport system substrate-binding protein
MSRLMHISRRTLLKASQLAIAMPYVARAQAVDQVKMSLEFRIYGGNAPSFLAIENGIYKNLGLDVIPEGSSGSGECITRVAAGVYPFGLADASALVEFASRNPDASPQLILPIFDVFPAVILSIHKKIKSLVDLKGLKLGTGTSDAGVKIFPALLALNKTDPNSFSRTTVDIKLRDTMLLAGKVDAVIAFDYTAIFNLIDNGVKMDDISLLYFSDLGFNFFGNSLIVNKDYAQRNPDVVRRMAIAVARSWVAASKNRDAAIAAVMKREKLLNAKTELARMNWVIDKLIRSNNVRKNGIGNIDDDRVNKAVALIKEGFNLPTMPLASSFIDKRFIPSFEDRNIG